MKRDVYVHLGAHKSASTTLQQNLELNKERLKEKGFWYISPSEIAKSPLGRHFREISQGKFKAEPTSYLDSVLEAKSSAEELMRPALDKNKMIFSWEGFLGHSALDRYQGIYTTIEIVARSLKEIFDNHNSRFLMVTRRQDDFIESCYLQQIKEKRSVQFDDFIKKIDPNRTSWLFILDSMEKNLGKDSLSVVPFELIKYAGTSHFVAECLGKLTMQEGLYSDFAWKEKSNPSISGVGVDIALQTLPLLDGEEVKKNFIRFVFANLSSDKHGKPRYFDDFTRRLLLSFCRNENSALFNKYISDYSSNQSEFGTKVFEYYTSGV